MAASFLSSCKGSNRFHPDARCDSFVPSRQPIRRCENPISPSDTRHKQGFIRSRIVACVSSCIRQTKELLSCLECCTAQVQRM
jgi:hypothetical protein